MKKYLSFEEKAEIVMAMTDEELREKYRHWVIVSKLTQVPVGEAGDRYFTDWLLGDEMNPCASPTWREVQERVEPLVRRWNEHSRVYEWRGHRTS